MSDANEAPSEDEESDESIGSNERERTKKEIEEETGGVVETEHGRRYRVQIISNSGSSEQPSQL